MVEQLHGRAERERSEAASRILFDKSVDLSSLDDDTLELIYPAVDHKGQVILAEHPDGLSVAELFVASTLCQSNGEVKRLVKEGGANLNGQRVTDPTQRLSTSELATRRFVLLRQGKKRFGLVKIMREKG